MPNSLNYGKPLTNTLFQRPDRITPSDLRLLRFGESQVIFGSTDRDVVELWIYNPDGSFAAHANLGPTDENLRQATFVDQTGAFETININLRNIAKTLDVQPGRYAMVANFFRNEVGSEEGNKLYIADITDDRTELRLQPIEVNDEILTDLYEFIAPSVPRQIAKGLIDQAFGRDINAPDDQEINSSLVERQLEKAIPGTLNRIAYAGAFQEYLNLYATILDRTYKATLDLLAADVFNYAIQQIELNDYVAKALHAVIYSIKQSLEYDARFSLE